MRSVQFSEQLCDMALRISNKFMLLEYTTRLCRSHGHVEGYKPAPLRVGIWHGKITTVVLILKDTISVLFNG